MSFDEGETMRMKTVGLAAAVALTLAACGSETDDGQETPDVPIATRTVDESDDTADDAETPSDENGAESSDSPDSDTTEPDRTTDLNGYDFDVTLEDAIAISDEETGGGTIYQVGMDWSRDGWVWEIDTMADGEEWELEIHATTGEILKKDRERDDDDEKQLELDSVIGHEAAMEAAVAEVPGKVTEWELDWDDNRQQYSVEIDDDVDVSIDALSGDVIEVDN